MIKTGKISHQIIYEFTISVNMNIENQLDFSFISKWKYIKLKSWHKDYKGTRALTLSVLHTKTPKLY